LNGSVITASAAGGGGNFSAGVSTGGNTVGNTGVTGTALVFVGTNNITLSQATGTGGATITISGNTVAAQAVNFSAGTTSSALGSVIFSNSNGISFGLNGSTITASGGGVTTGGFYALGNTTQNSSTTLALSAHSFNALGAMTMGFSNGSIQVSAPATSSLVGNAGLSVSVSNSTLSVYAIPRTRLIYPSDNLTAISAPGQGSISVQYVPVGWPVTASRVDALVSWAGASTASAVTMGIAMSAYAAIFTNNAGTLSSLSSGSTQTTYTYASNNAGQTQLLTGAVRPISVPVNVSMTPGEYFVAFNFSTNSTSVGAATTNLAQSISMMGGNLLQTAVNYAEFTNQTASSTNLLGGMGVYTATSAGIGGTLGLANIAQTGASLSQANIGIVFRNA
jgi:hypothetical protein